VSVLSIQRVMCYIECAWLPFGSGRMDPLSYFGVGQRINRIAQLMGILHGCHQSFRFIKGDKRKEKDPNTVPQGAGCALGV
jgi:hypothetical protein